MANVLPEMRSLLPKEESPGSNTRSQTSWAHALSWMDTCSRGHATCKPAQPEGVFKPTRLLLVSKDPDYIYLRENDEVPSGTRYTTLSHCWGKVVLGTLLTTNVSDRKSGIEIKSLVQTFQDAIEVTRRLKVDYIWIDCLCIIQDSRQDWQRESLVMGSVYGNSYCDIAATASSDGRGGLFRERDARAVQPCVVGIGMGGVKQYHYLSDLDAWWHDFERSPLNVRAWVLQERLLSPRVLHFCRDQLLWECNELRACERYPTGLRDPLPSAESPRIFRIAQKRSRRKQDIFEVWSPVVQAYSACAITKDTDRLVALHGIAATAQKVLGCRYVSGLWERGLESQLAWSVVEPETSHRPAEHVAPSWSWASVVGEVTLFPRGDPVDEEKYGGGKLCEVLEVRNPGDAEQEVAFISRAALVVRCYLVPITVIPISRDDWTGEMDDGWQDEGKGSEDGDAEYEGSELGGGEIEVEEISAQAGNSYGEISDDEERAPWVMLYRTSDGGSYDVFLERELDVADEWLWTEAQERWLMPTWSSYGSAVRGLILERRPEDGGKFHRCGTFDSRLDDEKSSFWNSCFDFVGRAAEGLEKRRFDSVLRPVASLSGTWDTCQFRDDVEQFVISVM